MMHKIFGKRKEVNYFDRPGAYLIPIRNGKIGLVRLPKGLFLIGGGINPGETEEQTIERESLEEIGFKVEVKEKIGTAETFANHSTLGPFHPIQSYYLGDVLDKFCNPIEKDHEFVWIDYDELKGNMFSAMQNWAVNLAWEKTH